MDSTASVDLVSSKQRIDELQGLFAKQPRLLAGNLQIIACAGAGKTDFLSWRTAFLISKGLAKSENIVAFTFTERAAEELKFRIRHHIRELLGHQPDMGDMYIGTIHSFCFKLLQEFVPEFRVFDVLDEGKRYAFVSSLRQDLNYEWLKGSLVKRSRRPFNTREQSWILNSFLRSVDITREEMHDPEDLSVSDSFTEAFKVYNQALGERRFLDFSSMMSIAVNALEQNKKLLKEVRQRFTHIMVDEYQDVNPIQERLVNLLAGPSRNLCVVGDDDQSIYQWRGSTVENIISFAKRYKDVFTYELPVNFRSTDYIVSCANEVIKHNDPRRLPKKMKPGGGTGQKGDIYKLAFDHLDHEVAFVVSRIKELIGTEFTEKGKPPRGLAYSDIAIFFRSVRYDARPYIDALRHEGIPVAVSGVGGLFEAPEADVVFELLSYLGEFGKIWDREAQEAYIPDIEDIYTHARDHFLLPSKRAFIKYFEDLKAKLESARRVSLQGLYGDVLNGLGLTREEMHDTDDEVKLYNLGRISQAISDYEGTRTYTTYKDIEGFCWFIRNYAESNYDAGAGDDRTLALNAVQVMTLHGTKGLGFPVVFMPYCVQRKKQTPDTGFIDPEKFDFSRYQGSELDDRRLFYVGMTRAKKFLFLSYPKTTGKRTKKPHQYFTEVPDKYCVTSVLPDPVKRKKLEPTPATDIIRFPTSFSELCYHISCGYDYKLRFIYGFNPELVQAIGYGRQVHNILNVLHKQAQETGKIPSIKDAEKIVEEHFYLRHAAREQVARLKASALKSVHNYLKLWAKDFSLSIKSERSFEMDVENALISGVIDLLKRESEAQPDILEIIDFKTGKHQIESERMELQVQLYTVAARDALGLNVKKAYLHYLDDEKIERVEVLTTPKQMDLAMRSISHTIKSITGRSFPRDALNKRVCFGCDWNKICPQKSK